MESAQYAGIVSFLGGDNGKWDILSMNTITGISLPPANKLAIVREDTFPTDTGNSSWVLKAFISNLRYTSRAEKTELDKSSQGLGLPSFNHAALIPIQKSAAWWALAQDERRKIFEEDSRHIATSAKYLSVISRQLYHCKDLGEAFDFLTWFEFAGEHEPQFDELCYMLRKTEEWKYVIREVDIRLAK